MDFRISEWMSGFQSGFLDFRLDFWISQYISGFQIGFLDFNLDFWISQWISAFQFVLLSTVYEIFFVTDPLYLSGFRVAIATDKSVAIQARRHGGFEGVRSNPPFGLQKILYAPLNFTF